MLRGGAHGGTNVSSRAGRPRTELELLRALVGGIGEGAPTFRSSPASRASARPAARRAGARGRTPRAASCWRAAPPSSSSELPFGVVVDAFDAYLASLEPRTFEPARPPRAGRARRRVPVLGRSAAAPRARRAAERFRAHRAVRELLERLAAASRWCWSSTTCTGPTARRSSWSPTCCAARPRRPCCSRAATARARPTRRCWRRSTPPRGGESRSSSSGPLTRRGRARWSTATRARDACTRQRRQPLLLLQLARSAAGRPPRARPPRPTAARPRSRPPSPPNWPRCRRAPRGARRGRRRRRGPVRPRPGRRDRRRRRGRALDALDELVARDLVRAAPVPAASASATPSSAARSTRRPRRARGWPPTRARAEALAARGAPADRARPPRRQSARRGDVAAIAVLREAGEATAQRAPGAPRGGSRPRCALLPAYAAAPERHRAAGQRSPRAGAAGRFAESRATMLTALELAPDDDPNAGALGAGCAVSEQLLGDYEEAVRSLPTPSRTSWARLADGRRADDARRVGQGLRERLRGHARLGGAAARTRRGSTTACSQWRPRRCRRRDLVHRVRSTRRASPRPPRR